MDHPNTIPAHGPPERMLLDRETIDAYLESKAAQGVARSSLRKYASPLLRLLRWAGEPAELTAQALQSWRDSLEDESLGKQTIQKQVSVVNEFLRWAGRKDLCIPRPLRSDLTGRTFGYLTALEPTRNRLHRYVLWRCTCRCGREVEVPAHMLTAGNTTSCGCLNAEILRHHNRYEEGTELRQALEEKVHSPGSASGYVGVYPKGDKWVAVITYKKVHYHLGTYSSLEDAVKARARAKEAVMEDAARIYAETDPHYGEAPRRPPRPPRQGAAQGS